MGGGSRVPDTTREYSETGDEPEYVVNRTTYESAPGGIMRGFVWKLVHGKYKLQFTFLVTPAELVQMGREAITVGSDAHNLSQWGDFTTEH